MPGHLNNVVGLRLRAQDLTDQGHSQRSACTLGTWVLQLGAGTL
jgi:hypothetical protein